VRFAGQHKRKSDEFLARFAALHLDTCSVRQDEVAKISHEEICRSRKRGKRLVPRTKLLRLLNKVSRPFIFDR
jgi:hypothetical protein